MIVKGNELLIHTILTELEGVLLKQRGYLQKDFLIPFVWNSVQDQMKDCDGKQNSDSPGLGWEGRLAVMGQEETGVGDQIFCIMIVIVLTGLCSTLFKNIKLSA